MPYAVETLPNARGTHLLFRSNTYGKEMAFVVFVDVNQYLFFQYLHVC